MHAHAIIAREFEGSEEGEELFREGGGTLRASQRQGFDVPSSTWGGDDGGQVMTAVSFTFCDVPWLVRFELLCSG